MSRGILKPLLAEVAEDFGDDSDESGHEDHHDHEHDDQGPAAGRLCGQAGGDVSGGAHGFCTLELDPVAYLLPVFPAVIGVNARNGHLAIQVFVKVARFSRRHHDENSVIADSEDFLW